MLAHPLLLGLALGVRHALEPDHLAAITTLVPGSLGPASAARTGAAWGVGHAAAIVLFGGVMVGLGIRVPAPLALVLDLAVAAMLVVLGAGAILRANGVGARGAGANGVGALGARALGGAPPRRSTMVGFVHGASGTAAITLVCLTTIPSAPAALAFLLVFALGSLVSMSVMSGLLATPLTAFARRGERTTNAMRVGGGVLAFAAAAWVAVEAFRGV